MAAARDAVDLVLTDRGLRRSAPQRTGESLLRGAWCSAALDGAVTPWEDAVAGALDEPVLADAVRLSTALLSVVPALSTTPRQALARLHTLASGPEVPDDARGRPRDAESAARLAQLGDLLTRPTRAPALVVAAVVHAELATARPFGSGDGLVARAAERLVLVSRGVDPASLVVPEDGHLAAGVGAYSAALARYAEGGRSGVHAWLLHCAEAYARGAEASPVAGEA